jgi:hypothetical protein
VSLVPSTGRNSLSEPTRPYRQDSTWRALSQPMPTHTPTAVTAFSLASTSPAAAATRRSRLADLLTG